MRLFAVSLLTIILHGCITINTTIVRHEDASDKPDIVDVRPTVTTETISGSNTSVTNCVGSEVSTLDDGWKEVPHMPADASDDEIIDKLLTYIETLMSHINDVNKIVDNCGR